MQLIAPTLEKCLSDSERIQERMAPWKLSDLQAIGLAENVMNTLLGGLKLPGLRSSGVRVIISVFHSPASVWELPPNAF